MSNETVADFETRKRVFHQNTCLLLRLSIASARKTDGKYDGAVCCLSFFSRFFPAADSRRMQHRIRP
jgi:hypothetical protein